MAAHGHPIASNAWARARLTRGSSGGQIWEITGQYPEARLSLGADPSAGWPIQAPGVAGLHCELFWDGQSLWVADTYQVGSTFLDGQRVTDWVQIEGPAEIRFGGAAMDIETSAPLGQQMVSRPSEARPVTVTDMVAPPDDGRPSAPLFGGAAGDQSVPDLENEATRLAPSPVRPLDQERTQIAAPSPPASPHGADLRPRLGGSGSDGHAAEATRMVSMPSPSGPPPAFGHRSPAPVVAPPPAAPGMPNLAHAAPPMQPHAPPSAGPPGPPAGAHPAAAPPASPHPAYPQSPQQPQQPQQQGAAPGWGAPPGQDAPLDPGSPFVAPPQPAADAESGPSVLDKVVAALKPEDSKAKTDGKQAMPTRTWILLAVTVIVTVGWLLWDDAPAETPAPPTAPATTQATAEGDPPTGETEPGDPPTETPTAGTTEAASGQGSTETPGAETGPSPSPTAAAGSEQAGDDGDDEEEGPSIERRAADAYIGGRYAEALELYRRLAAANPGDGSFAGMVSILERRIRAQCTDGTGPGGQPCDDSP